MTTPNTKRSCPRRPREPLAWLPKKGGWWTRQPPVIFASLRGVPMRTIKLRWPAVLLASLAVAGFWSSPVHAACCYFSAQNMDILQPAQKVFITWDPSEKVETFTVQPKFEGNALDFGMVIPTPSQPKLHEMPRDFFKHLAIYTIMKQRQSPRSE